MSDSKTPTIEQVASVYVQRRDRIAELGKQVDELKAKQAKTEEWFAARLNEQGAEAVRTAVGTIYKYRSESVTVAEWDTFVSQNLIAPVVAALVDEYGGYISMGFDDPLALKASLEESIKTALPLHLVNKAVNKTAALELMGEIDEKTKGRPNPPLAGINYTAVQKVGVRKS